MPRLRNCLPLFLVISLAVLELKMSFSSWFAHDPPQRTGPMSHRHRHCWYRCAYPYPHNIVDDIDLFSSRSSFHSSLHPSSRLEQQSMLRTSTVSPMHRMVFYLRESHTGSLLINRQKCDKSTYFAAGFLTGSCWL